MTLKQEAVVSTFAEWLVTEIDQKDLGNVPWKRDGILIDTAWWRHTDEIALLSLTIKADEGDAVTRDLELPVNDGTQARIVEVVSSMLTPADS
jgi:hypothetical protein